MAVAAGFEPQVTAFALEGLLQWHASALGGFDQGPPRHLQQAAVHRVGHGFFLHGGVHNDVLELGGVDGLHADRRIDGGLEDFLHVGLAQAKAKAAHLGGATRLRYSSAIIRRSGRRGRSALLMAPTPAGTGLKRSTASAAIPGALGWREKLGASAASIASQSRRRASTASGWLRSII